MDYKEKNKYLCDLIDKLSEIENFEDTIQIITSLLLNTIYQGKAGCFVSKQQKEYFDEFISEILKNLILKIDEILSLDENSFINLIKKRKINNPLYADIYDESLSEFKKMKEQYNKSQ